MSKACWTKPCVKNSRGEDVVSKLWNDIYRMTGNDFNKSVDLYKIATSKTFLDSVMDIAEFDKNGQITAHSFFSLSGKSVEIDDVIKTLNKTYDISSKDIDEILSNVERFNSEESYKEDYIPLVSKNENDLISLTITDRNVDTVDDLEKKIYDMKLTRLIASRLKSLGVAYDFVGDSKYSGRFSTENADKMFDGMYHVIDVSQGANVNETLVEEAAHLATVSMRDNTLIKRLISMINEDTMKDLFSQEEIESAMLNSEQGKLELAGLLVKKAMLGKKFLWIGDFMSRVTSAIYKVFSKGNLDSLLSDKRRAKLYARQIANGFLFNENSLDIDKGIKENRVELFSVNLAGTNKLLQDTLRKITSLNNSVENASMITWSTLLDNLKKKKITENKDIDKVSFEEAAGMTATAINNLTSDFITVMGELQKLDFNNEINQEELTVLHSAVQMYRTLCDILEIAKDYLDENPNEDSDIIKTISDAVNNVYSAIDTDEALPRKLLDYERAVTAQIFSEILGRDTYEESARIIHKNGLSFSVKDPVKYNMAVLAKKYINDRERSFVNMAADMIRHDNNAKDITTQLFYQAIRRLKVNQSRRYLESVASLKEIESEVKEANIDVKLFYEKYKDGSFTGNFIGRYNIAQFEQDREVTLNKIKEDFLNYLKKNGEFDDYMEMTREEKHSRFIDFRNLRSDWLEIYNADRDDIRSLNDILNGDSGEVDPEIAKYFEKYKNQEYEELCKIKDFEKLLNKIKEWKRTLDKECLLEGVEGCDDIESGYRHYVKDRIPQFRGTFMERYRNKKLIDADLYDQIHVHELNIDVLADDFGSPLTDTKIDEFNDPISYSDDVVKRIPLYGINKLADMRELSTDLFSSLACYAGMANRYFTTQQLYPQLVVMHDALNNRKGGSVQAKSTAASFSSRRRERLINEFVTGKIQHNAVEKSVVIASMVASIRLLCFNIMSALKNWGGGYRVILADALSGMGDFSTSALLKATWRSFNPKHTITQLATILTNKEKNWDKYLKLVRRWDAARNPHVSTVIGGNGLKKATSWLLNVAMSNYSITDDSLIGIIYESFMDSPNYYDAKTGKKIKLSKNGYTYDSENNPTLKNSIVKNRTDIAYWKLLTDALDSLDYIKENNAIKEDMEKLHVTDDNTISKLIDYCENRNIDFTIINEDGSIKTIDEIKNNIVNQLTNICFTETDEVNLCERINDYIISSQGLYGALNANAMQSDAYLSMFTKLKGWQFGFIQRNLLSNSSILTGDYKNSIASCELLALGCIFGNIKDIIGDNISKDAFKFRAATLVAVMAPFAIRRSYEQRHKNKADKELRQYLQKCGWSPDQLDKLSNFIVSWLILAIITYASRYLLGRGNYKQHGNDLYKVESKRKGVKLQKKGLLFSNSWISINESKFQQQFNDWKKQGFPYVLNQKKKPDGSVVRFSDLPKPVNKFSEKTIFYCVETGQYYKPNHKKRRWEQTEWGFYRIGTEAWNEHIDAMRYRQYLYNKDSLGYALLGAIFRFNRGVQDEGESLLNPYRWARDMADIANPVVWGGGISQFLKLGKMLLKGKFKDAGRTEANFWLNKFGLEIDGDGYPVLNKRGEMPITMLDWYDKQEAIDRYQNLPIQ